MNKLPSPRKGKPRPESKGKMPRQVDKPDERHHLSHPNQQKNPQSAIHNSTSSEMPNSWQSDIHERRRSTDPSNSMSDNCFGFNIMPSMLADCFANRLPCDEDPSYKQKQGVFQYSYYE
jgi:hypothetical protein